MKPLILILCAASLALSQSERSNRPRTNPQPTPSALMTTSLPEQDITLTIHVSSDLATAIEKRRRDNFAPVVNADGSTVLTPKQSTLADQIVFDMQSYFAQLLTRYPASSVKAAQDKAKAAIQEAEDTANKAAKVTKK